MVPRERGRRRREDRSGEIEIDRLDIKNWFYPDVSSDCAAFGLVVFRVVAGLGLMHHGWPKIQHAFSWMPAEVSMPGILQALAALSEFGGGLAWVVGFLTPLAALGVGCTMVTALGIVHLPAGDPFVNLAGGSSYELASLYSAVALLLLMAGAGRYSLDALLFGCNRNSSSAADSGEVKGAAG